MCCDVCVHEDLYPEEEQEQQKELAETFQPLLEWLKAEAKDVVRDGKFAPDRSIWVEHNLLSPVIISNRLVSSPCAVVADVHGFTANVEKLMSA